MKSRNDYNLAIVQEILAFSDKFPDMRFHQILHSLRIVEMEKDSEGTPIIINDRPVCVDHYHEESKKTYDKMVKRHN